MNRQLLRLVASQLRVGSPLPFGVRDEHGKLLLAKGQVIANDAQLETLLARGLYADKEELEAAGKQAAAAADARRSTIFDIWEQQIWGLKRLLASLAEADFPSRCDEFAAQVTGLIQRDPDIAIYLSVRQDTKRLVLYGLTHSLHTALVCFLMAQRMGWPDERARTLVKAALTMNMTIIEAQGQFAVQGRLTEKQRQLIAEHPDKAAAGLMAAGVEDEAWLQAISEHHERAGGGGYPLGLASPCENAAMLRMADVFMAKISPREGRTQLSVQDAARQLFVETKGSQAAAAIIKEYGIYPPGNFVQLASGELAVVIRRGPNAHAPVAAAITDKSGTPTTTSLRRDTAQSAYAIKAALPETALTLRLPPERLYGLT
ncbi:MAG TPA: HD domain-containing phosphohydrolase [Burkholderiaceae bacterium]|nr:HD domain-containing phosphohydrolase [Burkholderiaceae bacterium]